MSHPREIDTLRRQVQYNCDVADAHHAGDYTLCIYLLKMREYFRWERGLSFGAPRPSDEIGNWITEREAHWESLEGESFRDIELAGRRFSPFDAPAINRHLLPRGLVYSGGIGANGKPHFFLGRLRERHLHDAFEVLVAEDEMARDLTAPPAMSRQETIFVRRDSIRRMIWEKLEEWRWKRRESPLARAFSVYDFENDLESALESVTDTETRFIVWHEIGEVEAGRLLGETWHEMIALLPRSRIELMLRAVRDHLADCVSTLPKLLEEGSEPSIHFYFGNLQAMRRELFPSLLRAYDRWLEGDDLESLRRVAGDGADHWRRVATEAVRHFDASRPEESADRLQGLLESSRL